ncbi:MAG: hypothetical protein R3202_04260 [Candidatus Competibacterales bacterium]|nr:hypothetical protein [Candidatus Competibacterales bacterium]
MFQSFTVQPENPTLEAAPSGESGDSPNPTVPLYRPGLTADLRSEQKALIRSIDELLGEITTVSAPTLTGRLETLGSRFARYTEKAQLGLFDFLEPAALQYGLDDIDEIRGGERALRELATQVAALTRDDETDASDLRTLQATLEALREDMRLVFEHDCNELHPLYHKYGVQQMRQG